MNRWHIYKSNRCGLYYAAKYNHHNDLCCGDFDTFDAAERRCVALNNALCITIAA